MNLILCLSGLFRSSSRMDSQSLQVHPEAASLLYHAWVIATDYSAIIGPVQVARATNSRKKPEDTIQSLEEYFGISKAFEGWVETVLAIS